MLEIYLKLFLTAFFWGGTFISGKMLAEDVTPFCAAFFRFMIAATCLYAIAIRRYGKIPLPSQKQFLPVLFMGLSGVFAYNAFFFNGLKLIPASRASIIIANNPIVISLLAAFLLGETLSLVRIVGIVVSVFGAIIAISDGDPKALFYGGIGAGDFLILGCVASWSTYSLVGKWAIRDLSPLLATAHAATVGCIFLFVPAWMEGMPWRALRYSWADWTNMLYLGIFGTVLGFVWYYDGIREIGTSRASLFINFVPICAILLAHFILDETLTPSLFLGAVMVIAGVSMNQLAPDGKKNNFKKAA